MVGILNDQGIQLVFFVLLRGNEVMKREETGRASPKIKWVFSPLFFMGINDFKEPVDAM